MHNIEPNFMKIMMSATGKEISMLSPEVELVDVYHRLYSPDMYSNWNKIKEHEKILWKQFNDMRNCIITKPVVNGGRVNYADTVLDWLKGQRGYVLVGDSAARSLSNKVMLRNNTVQIVVSNPKAIIASLREYMSTSLNASINVKKYDVNLPNDYRIRKFVISATINDNTFYIANIFNSAAYELVPFKCVDKLNIGTQAVLMRFMFIDMWFMRVLRYFGKVEQHRYKEYMKSLYHNLDIIHAQWSVNETKVADSFPMYIGTYISESVSKKKSGTIFPYYPAKHKLETGKYRKVN